MLNYIINNKTTQFNKAMADNFRHCFFI